MCSDAPRQIDRSSGSACRARYRRRSRRAPRPWACRSAACCTARPSRRSRPNRARRKAVHQEAAEEELERDELQATAPPAVQVRPERLARPGGRRDTCAWNAPVNERDDQRRRDRVQPLGPQVRTIPARTHPVGRATVVGTRTGCKTRQDHVAQRPRHELSRRHEHGPPGGTADARRAPVPPRRRRGSDCST